MGLYQGRALRSGGSRTRPPARRTVRAARGLGAIALVVGLVHLPWAELRKRVAVLTEIRTEGLHYLDADEVASIAGIEPGQDLLSLDFSRARQGLLLHPRIERAQVSRLWPRGIRLRVVERVPVLLVRHGRLWEIDSSGVLLPPLSEGAVADVPLLAGANFEDLAEGSQLCVSTVLRGLNWVEALSARDLQMNGDVSEIDVADPRITRLYLMDGARVVSDAWPPGARVLSALRVVRADLRRRGVAARELDLRFRDQVIVRPLDDSANRNAGGPATFVARSQPDPSP